MTNLTKSRITGKLSTALATEFAAICREHGHDVHFTHGGLFRYGSAVDLADLHVVATSARWYFNARNELSSEDKSKRIAEKVAEDYFRAFGLSVPAPVVVLSPTGHGAYTLAGGAQ